VTDLHAVRGLWVFLALVLATLAPFGSRPVVAGAAALLGNAADDHEHRVSVRTSGVCADVVIEHDAKTPHDSAREGGARHEHREICLPRGADALLSRLSSAGLAAAGAWSLALAELPVRAFTATRLAARSPDRALPGLRALRTIVLVV
jgi:hypothetical protein